MSPEIAAQAKDLLLTTALQVRVIAVRLGYANSGTFSYAFAQAVGMTPTNFRKQAAGLPPVLRTRARRVKP